MPGDADKARALLAYANYAKVGAALRVSRATVADWAKGQSVTPYRLRQLEQLLRPDLEVAKEPPPEWARAMERRILEAIERNSQLIGGLAPADLDEASERVIERLEALEQPGDEVPRDSGGAGGPAVSGRRDREPE